MARRSTGADAGSPLRRRRSSVLGVPLAVLVVAWLGLYAAAGSGIARGTTVLGVAIGGQSREQAARDPDA